ncbi:MAG: OadG family transporter subunit [Glaciecola sp.]|jgi:oxaloacetate decarboxylase gamma subunit
MSTQMNDQLIEAGILLAVGMSVVFAFLILLIGGIQAIAWFCRKFPSDDVIPYAAQNRGVQTNNKKSPTSVSPQVAAAITAAVHTHRHTTLKS